MYSLSFSSLFLKSNSISLMSLSFGFFFVLSDLFGLFFFKLDSKSLGLCFSFKSKSFCFLFSFDSESFCFSFSFCLISSYFLTQSFFFLSSSISSILFCFLDPKSILFFFLSNSLSF